MKPLERILTLCLLAGALGAADAPRLHGRIVNKQGMQNARQWTLEIAGSRSEAVGAAKIAGIRFTQTSLGDGAACTPAVKQPASFPLSLGNIPAGGSAQAEITIDFTGCSNRAQFTVEVPLSGADGARGMIRRSNDYR